MIGVPLLIDVPLTLYSVFMLLFITFIGLMSGAIPGLGPAITIALMIPVLEYFQTPIALLLLGSTYIVGVYGGSISAIVLNVPGTGASACTTLDGYPMSKKGKAITALSISTTASIFGGAISLFIIFSLTDYLSDLVLMFGSSEYFLMILLGIATIAVVSKGNFWKGMIAGILGLLLTSIGIAGTSGELRYTFDLLYLYDGIQFLPVIIGVFAVTEMMMLGGRGETIADTPELQGSVLEGIREVLNHKVTLVRSALIGLIVGAIPGAGGTVANFVSYGIAKTIRGTVEDGVNFGEGNSEGIVAAEGSNNALVPGSLMPTLTFGIPGNSTTAVMLGALIFLGFRPGPTLFTDNIDVVYLLYTGVAFGTLFLVILFWLGPYIGKVTMLNKAILIPAVLVVSTMGTYSLRYNFGDVILMTAFGFIGYIMVRHDYSVISLILGLILGTTAETTLYRSLQISSNIFEYFLSRTISVVIILSILLLLFITFFNTDRVTDVAIRFLSKVSERVRLQR